MNIENIQKIMQWCNIIEIEIPERREGLNMLPVLVKQCFGRES